MMHAAMLAQRTPVRTHQFTSRLRRRYALLPQVRVNESGIIAVGNKANLEALALVGYCQVHVARQPSHIRLAHLTQRKQAASKLRLSQSKQEVSLVLGLIHGGA